MREPSDLIPYYEFWNLSLKDRAAGERWYQENRFKLSFWDGIEMMMPGFYRYRYTGHSSKMQHVKGQFIPVSIWIEQQVNDIGELIADEELLIKSGTFKPIHANSDYLGEVNLMMAWEQCRKHPVTMEMHDYAIKSYLEDSAYRWWDDKEAPVKPVTTEIKDAPSLF